MEDQIILKAAWEAKAVQEVECSEMLQRALMPHWSPEPLSSLAGSYKGIHNTCMINSDTQAEIQALHQEIAELKKQIQELKAALEALWAWMFRTEIV